ncbi:murein biosynthesis integral membrane protein MurJ [Corynebacterium renale]|uniref:murein biosynthesis integral membrane protein MurJ n=1 Tax=Corynebacterium renale TaxID=1724 RepID=UPI0038B9D5D3
MTDSNSVATNASATNPGARTQGVPVGLRSRIVEPSPPAPVPQPRPKPGNRASEREEVVVDKSKLTAAPAAPPAAPTATATAEATAQATASQEGTSDRDVVRASGSMAVATLISRITGFFRNALIGASLGGAVGSAFTVANTLPNLITEIVLGAVLTSLVVPVLVRAEKEDPDRGAAFVRRLFTLAFTLLGVITVAAVVGAPWLTKTMLRDDGEVNISMATSFAYLLLPQIIFYGLFSLFMAVLNTKGVFKPGAWAPVANNIVCIAVLLLYMLVPGRLNPAASVTILDPHVLLLGAGTTLGVVVQLLIMIPPLKRAGIDLRPLWGIDARLKQFGGMALAIVVYVAISQLGYVITTNIASAADESAPLIYQQHWLLLQMPYGIIGVTLLTAIMPRLSRNAADGDDKAVVRDLTMATKLTFIALIPIVIFMTAYGPQLATALFEYGAFNPEDAYTLGLTVSFAAFTLIPYALVLLHLRVFYAREEAWIPTFIIAGITITKVVLSAAAPLVASSTKNVVILLGAANGFGFVAGAVIGVFLLKRKLGNLGMRQVLRTSMWAAAAAIVGVAASTLTHWLLGLVFPVDELGSIATIVLLGVLGVIFLIVTGIVLSFSRLPEVQNLAAIFQRIPFVRRFIRTDPEEQLAVGEVSQEEKAVEFSGLDSFVASPVPPPMSAGVVRGPRLVPGAPVSDGRFRLLREHGTAQGAQFWQAQDLRTKQLVALTFVDTAGASPLAPLTPAQASAKAAEVTRRTQVLSSLKHPGIATGIQVRGYRSGCMVVADWVEGSSLRSVAEAGGVDPQAAALALSPIAAATGAAHAEHVPLGLDNWSRIRISTDGHAVLAFPAVLPDNSRAEDMEALASALNLLIDDTAPADVTAAKKLAEQAADDDSGESEITPEDIAEALRRAGEGEEPVLDVEVEQAPTVEAQTGFGDRSMTRRGTGLLIVGAVGVVTLAAAAVTYIVGVLGGDDPDAPVTSDSLQGAATTTTQPQRMSLVFPATDARVWGAPGTDISMDNPEDAPLAIDDDPATSWATAEYPNGLGTKPGVGLRVAIAEDVYLQHLVLDTTDSKGAHYSIYALPPEVTPDTPLEELPRIADGTIRGGKTNIEPKTEGVPRSGAVLIWLTTMPVESGRVDINEVSVIGSYNPPPLPKSIEVEEPAEAETATP